MKQKKKTGQHLTTALKEKRGEKNQEAYCHCTVKSITKKSSLQMKTIFTMEETFNKQKDTVYARLSKKAHNLVPGTEQGHYPASEMVWWGGVISLHFCEKGVKTAVRNYQRDILTNVVETLNQTMFQNRPIFQQDSAPAHKAKTTQQWLENHVSEFISNEHWLSASPDLNPLDYKLRLVLEGMVCIRHHHNLESLKQALVEFVDNFPIDIICTVIDEWPFLLVKIFLSNLSRFSFYINKNKLSRMLT